MKGISPSLIAKIKDEILGPDYELSVAYVSKKKSLELNKRYRHKDTPANVLSFPLSKTSGEIILCPEARGEFSLGFLVIHGMLHLKGAHHSSKMEQTEARYDKKYFSGHRRRLADGASRRRRILQRRKNS